MAVTWTYDGVNTVTASFPSTVGHVYKLEARDPDSSTVTVTASLSSTTLTMPDFDTSAAVATYAAYVWDDTAGVYLDDTLFSYGQTGQAADRSGTVWSWDGSTTVSVTFTSVAGVQYQLLARPVSSSGGSATFDATGTSTTITISTLSLAAGEGVAFWVQINGGDVPQFSVRYGQQGSTSVSATFGSATFEAGSGGEGGGGGGGGGTAVLFPSGAAFSIY